MGTPNLVQVGLVSQACSASAACFIRRCTARTLVVVLCIAAQDVLSLTCSDSRILERGQKALRRGTIPPYDHPIARRSS